MAEHRCGLVALVGRPNVGKSTLLNRLVGQKLSIVTPRAQTTRHIITGIHSEARGQVVFIDTPGLHDAGKHALNRYMNRAAAGALADADVVVVIVEALKMTSEDESVFERLQHVERPIGLVINKVDRVKDKARLLPFIESLRQRARFDFVVPLSAQDGENCSDLINELFARLPAAPALYPVEQVTDRSERFIVAELIREQALLRLREEVPYGLAVEIEAFEERERNTWIGAVLWVSRDAHKGIVIGKGGAMLKDIGTAARHEIEHLLERPVMLKLWVKVREGWADDERALGRFGIE